MRKTLTAAVMLVVLASCKKDVNTDAGVYVNNPTEGEILASPYATGASTGSLLILNAKGSVISQTTTQGVAMNFRRWDINGKIRYTYLLEDQSGYHIPGYYAYVPGYEVITDENLNEIKRVYLASYNSITASSNNLLDAHDFILIDDNHYITMSYYETYPTNIPVEIPQASGVRVVTPVIQEILDDHVKFQWVGTDHPELYQESVEGNDFTSLTAAQDYLHLNSMTIDPGDQNLVCSFRNANLILKIDRSSGNIIWKLGGKHSDFPLTTDQVFLRQHHASFIDNGNTLLLLDNGEATERPYSRVLEIGLDQTARQIRSFSAFDIPGHFIQYMGSVQKINGHYFIGGGTDKSILEYDPATGEKSFEMTLEQPSYRSFKYEF